MKVRWLCAFLAAMALMLSGCSHHSATRQNRLPVSTAPLVTVMDGPIQLAVLAVDRHAASAAGSVPLNAGEHYVTVSLAYRNRSDHSVRVLGSSLLITDLWDQGGPITEVAKAPAAYKARTAVNDYFTCGLAVSPRSSGQPRVMPGHRVQKSPPDRVLAPGSEYGPYTLCFTVSGPPTQRLTLAWNGYRLGPTGAPLLARLP